jgi:LysM repeat protein
MKNIAPGLSLKKYKGNKHEQGGIMVNALGNKTKDINKAVAEVEGGEYSYRYNPTNPKDNYILSEQLGIANMAKQADRFKNNDRISYNTRTNLLNKSVKLNEVLKAQQEQSQMQMALGGMLKKYGDGGFSDNGPIDDNIQNYYKNTTTRDVVSTPGNELTNVPIQPTAPLLSGSQKFNLPTKVQSVNPKITSDTKALDVSKEMQQASTPVKQKKNNFKGALSAVAGAVSALGPIGQGVGTAMQLAPYAIDLGKAMFDKTSVQDLQTQGSAMRLPNTTYAKNGGKLNVKPLPILKRGDFLNQNPIIPKTSQQDSVRNYAYNIMKFEKTKGKADGTGLLNAGNPALGASNVDVPENVAVDWFMKNIVPKVQKNFVTAREQADAGDFLYNSGKDVRTYAYQEYLRKTDPDNKTGWKDNTGNWKDRPTKDKPKVLSNFDKLYNNSVGKLSEQDRLNYIKQGKDFYYQNIERGKGSINEDLKAYNSSWKDRIDVNNKYTDYSQQNPVITTNSPTNKPLVVAPPPVKTNIQTPANIVPNSATTTQVKSNPLNVKPINNVNNRLNSYPVSTPGNEMLYQPTTVTNNTPVVTNSTTQKIGDYSFDTTKLMPLTDLKAKLDKGEITEKDMVYITEDDRAVTKNPDGTYKFKETTMDEDSDIRIRNAFKTGINTLTTLPTTIKSNKPGVNNLTTLDVKKEMDIAKRTGLNIKPQPSESESSKLFKAGQSKQKLSEALMYGMAALPSEQIKTITPDYGRGDDAMSRMGLSTEPIRQEMMQGANKALELTRSQVGTAGQLQSRGQSIMSNLSSQLSQSQIQQQQYLNQLRGALAQREDTKSNVLAQSELTAREAKSAERAAKLDQLNNAISQTSAIGAGTMEQASKMSTIENENERFDRSQKQLLKMANMAGGFKVVIENGEPVLKYDSSSSGESNMKTPSLANPLVVKPNPNTTTTPVVSTPKEHVVKKGEGLNAIAAQYKIPVDKLLKLNNLKIGDTIHPNQKLKIE